MNAEKYPEALNTLGDYQQALLDEERAKMDKNLQSLWNDADFKGLVE